MCNHIIRQIGAKVLKEPATFILRPEDGDKYSSFSGTYYVVTQLHDAVCQKTIIRDFSHKYSTTVKVYAVIIKLHISLLFD